MSDNDCVDCAPWEEAVKQRANYLPAPAAFMLNMACIPLAEAFGHCVFLVGSAMERRDYRDVDVRAMVSDEMWERLFPGVLPGSARFDPLWSIFCSSVSLYLSQQTGLPIDFQVQQQSYANTTEKGQRCALGLFVRQP